MAESDFVERDDEHSWDSPRVRLFAVPMALLVGGLFSLSHGLSLLAWFFSIFFHELGHAVPAWLAGIPALPLPFGFCWVGEERATRVIVFFASSPESVGELGSG